MVIIIGFAYLAKCIYFFILIIIICCILTLLIQIFTQYLSLLDGKINNFSTNDGTKCFSFVISEGVA